MLLLPPFFFDQGCKTKDGDGDDDGDPRHDSNVINVNVIIVHSETSKLLHRHLNMSNPLTAANSHVSIRSAVSSEDVRKAETATCVEQRASTSASSRYLELPNATAARRFQRQQMSALSMPLGPSSTLSEGGGVRRTLQPPSTLPVLKEDVDDVDGIGVVKEDEADEDDDDEFKDCDSVIREDKSAAASPREEEEPLPQIPSNQLTTAAARGEQASSWRKLKTVIRSVGAVKTAAVADDSEEGGGHEPLRKRASTSAALSKKANGKADFFASADEDGAAADPAETEVMLRRANGVPGRKRRMGLRYVRNNIEKGPA